MGLPYHHPLITTPQRGDEDNIVVELRPSLPIYYRATTWGVPMQQHRIVHRMAIHYRDMA